MAESPYIPEGLTALTPVLALRNAPDAITWYKKVFMATEINRLTDPEGIIAHAELRISDCVVMLTEETPPHNKGPEMLGGTSVIMNLYVPDVDATVNLAVTEGASIIFPVADQFYGDRAGRIQDPFGHMWIVSKHLDSVTSEQMQQHMDESMK